MEETKEDFVDCSQKSFTERMTSQEIKLDLNDIKELTFFLMRELNKVAARTFSLLYKLIKIFQAAPKFVSQYLQVEYEKNQTDRWSSSIITQRVKVKSFSEPSSSAVIERKHPKCLR